MVKIVSRMCPWRMGCLDTSPGYVTSGFNNGAYIMPIIPQGRRTIDMRAKMPYNGRLHNAPTGCHQVRVATVIEKTRTTVRYPGRESAA